MTPSKPDILAQHPAIVLFDGACNMCNHSVQFAIKRDPEGHFKYASLQSELGQELLQHYKLPLVLDTIVLIENGKAYTHSSAPLRILRKSSTPWSLLYAFIIVPPFIRNGVYRWIAKNRYKWFGKNESCMMPTPELRRRFLDAS